MSTRAAATFLTKYALPRTVREALHARWVRSGVMEVAAFDPSTRLCKG